NMPTLEGNMSNLLKIYGSLTFVADMNVIFAGLVNFEATTTGKSIRMGGKSFSNQVKFNGIGGEWTLQDAFSTTNRISLNNGTLNTNNQIVNAVEFYSTSTATRALNMGNSVFNLYGNGAAWSATAPGMTLNCGTSVINCTSAGFVGGNLRYYDLNFTDASGSSTGIIQDANHFHDVFFASKANISPSNIFHNVTINGDAVIDSSNVYNDLSFNSGHTYILRAEGTQTINNRLFIQGSCISYILLQSSIPGISATVSKNGAPVLGYNIHLKDIHSTGGAQFIAYSSVDLGGNNGWNFSTLPPLQNPDIIGGPSPICFGATGVIYHIAPVQGAIYYQWSVPAGATILSGQGDTLIIVDFGTATSGNISVQSFNGCNYSTLSSTFGLILTAQLTPAVTLDVNPGNIVCSGATVNFTATATNTGNAAVNYDFKLNGSIVQTGISNIYSTTALINGDEVSCDISVSGNSCYAVTTATSNIILITVGTGIAATISLAATPPGVICSGTTVVFTATGTNTGTGNNMYKFKINGTSVQQGASNTLTTSTLNDGDVVSCEIIIGAGNCGSSNMVSSNKITIVSRKCDCDPGIPNAITPNGDGINDRWILSHGNCQFKVSVSVYNRYGSLIYHSDDYQNDWEGRYRSGTCPDGTYYYLVKTMYSNRTEKVFRGNVTILR
ncbi:MAG: gliding motility-associated C-terminal domain-containing protein, partial [Ferruginibacter sp.]